MSLQFILGRAGTGKTRSCLQSVAEAVAHSPLGPPILLLVPEQATFQVEQALVHSPGISGFQRAQVLSFRRLAYRILQERGGAALPPLRELGKLMLLRSILQRRKADLRLFGGVSSKAGFMVSLSAAMTELQAYGHDLGRLRPDRTAAGMDDSPILAAKLQDLALIFSAYQDSLRGRFTGPDAYLTLASSRLPGSLLVAGATVWVDGFIGFTPQELDLLGGMMKAACQVKVTLCLDAQEAAGLEALEELDETSLFHPTQETLVRLRGVAREAQIDEEPPRILDGGGAPARFRSTPALAALERELFRHPGTPQEGPAPAVQVVEAPNRRLEVEAVAREVLRLCREEGLRFREQALILLDVEVYQGLIEAAFADRGIPAFIDRRRSLAHHPLVELLRSALEGITSNWDYEPVFRYLKTDLVPLTRSEVDRLESYVLEHGLQGSRWYDGRPWTAMRRYSLEEESPTAADPEIDLAEINVLRDKASKALHTFHQRVTGSPERSASGKPASQKRGTVREMASALWELIEELGVAETLDRWSHEAEVAGARVEFQEHVQAFEGVVDLLDQVVEALGEEAVAPGQFLEILEAGLQGLGLGLIPPSLDQVLVGSLGRSRHPDLQAVFILGATDRALPRAHGEEPLLNDRERESLAQRGWELGPSSRTRLLHEQFLAYQALTRSGRRLWVSYPLADEEGRGLTPSPLIQRIRSILPGAGFRSLDPHGAPGTAGGEESTLLPAWNTPVELVSSLARRLRAFMGGQPLEEMWFDLYQWITQRPTLGPLARFVLSSLAYRNRQDPLPGDLARELFQEVIYTSISRLESYASCPFQHFARYILKLSERSLYRVEPSHMGQFCHAAMSRLVTRIRQMPGGWRSFLSSGQDPESSSGQALETVIHPLIDRVVDELAPRLQGEILLSSARYRYLLDTLGRRVKAATWAMIEHARRGKFEPVGVEVVFGRTVGAPALPPWRIPLPDGRSLELHGRIDRLDAAQGEDGRTFVRVIDYKSRPKKLQLERIFYGLDLQLPLYLAMALEGFNGLSGNSSLSLAFPVPALSHVEGKDRLLGGSRMGSKGLPAGAHYFPVHDPLLKMSESLPPEQIRARRLREFFKMEGLVLADPVVIELTDPGLSGTSAVIPVGIKKDGNFYAHSRVASEDQFGSLFRHLREQAISLASGMAAGGVEIVPYRLRGQTPCEWCDYHSLCRFDPSVDAHQYRRLDPMAEETFWGILQGGRER